MKLQIPQRRDLQSFYAGVLYLTSVSWTGACPNVAPSIKSHSSLYDTMLTGSLLSVSRKPPLTLEPSLEVHVTGTERRVQVRYITYILEQYSRSKGYKEMSSIFADQQRPRNTSPNAGGERGVAGSQPMSTTVHIT